jgi:hypothetical protein
MTVDDADVDTLATTSRYNVIYIHSIRFFVMFRLIFTVFHCFVALRDVVLLGRTVAIFEFRTGRPLGRDDPVATYPPPHLPLLSFVRSFKIDPSRHLLFCHKVSS